MIVIILSTNIIDIDLAISSEIEENKTESRRWRVLSDVLTHWKQTMVQDASPQFGHCPSPVMSALAACSPGTESGLISALQVDNPEAYMKMEGGGGGMWKKSANEKKK